MTKCVMVTGGAGFIGSHVCDKLLEQQYKVICIDNLNDYYDPDFKRLNIKHNLSKNNFIFHQVDILDYDSLHKIFNKYKPSKIIHLAAMAGVRNSISNPQLYYDVNCKGTINLLELSKLFNIDNFIFASSSSVYGENNVPFRESQTADQQISPYASTKKAGELLCYTYHNLYDLNIIALRFFTVYGPRGRPDMAPYLFTEKIIKDLELIRYGDGSSARDYTYVSDIVDGIVSCLDKKLGFEIINLGNSEVVTLNYLIKLIGNEVGKPVKLKQKGIPRGDVPITYADIEKAKRVLDYAPKVKIEEGIKELVKWYKHEKS